MTNLGSMMASLGVDTRGIDTAEGRLKTFRTRAVSTFKRVRTSVVSLQGAMIGLGATLAIKKFVDMTDSLTLMQGRLKLVTSSTEEFNKVSKELYKIANETRVAFISAGDLYARLGRSTRDLGVSQEQLLQVTKTINQALIVSGASATEANAALIQLSQGLASGALRGDELRSVLEQTPRLARAIAEGMGVTIGQLRTMGMEGKLTAETVIKALLSQKEVIEREFSQMPTTVGQALVVFYNKLSVMFARINEGIQFTQTLVSLIQSFGDLLDWINSTNVIPSITSSLGALWDLVVALPKETVNYFKATREEYKKLEEQATETHRQIAKEAESNWRKILNFMTKWGWDIVRVYKFMLQLVTDAFATMVLDLIESIKILAKEFLSLGRIIWNVLTFNFGAAKEEWGKLFNGMQDYNKKIEANWNAFTKRIKENWNEMIRGMLTGGVPGGAPAPGEPGKGKPGAKAPVRNVWERG